MADPYDDYPPPFEDWNEKDPKAQQRYERAKAKQRSKANGHAKVDPLEYRDLNDNPIPSREWVVPEHIPANNVTLLSGEGAVGKSILAQQLAACTALNGISTYDHDWIGLLPKGGPVQYISCEEDGEELDRRLSDIVRHYDTTRSALRGQLHMASWVDRELTALAVIDKKTDSLVRTDLFHQLETDTIRLRPKLIILDTSADLFGGNEISRSHTRQFISMLRKLAIAARNACGVLLLTHPSLEGIRSGSGLSGSTAWHNSCRARCVFKKVTDDKGEEVDPDMRMLEWRKNNYGPANDTAVLRWRRGVYVREGQAGSLEQQLRERNVEAVFLDLLRKRNAQDRGVSDKPGKNYAPSVFEESVEAQGAKPKIRGKDFAKAMDRLFDAKRIVSIAPGPASRPNRHIIETPQAAAE